MMVTDKQMAILRAALVGDDETSERLGGESDQDYGDALGVLMATAFMLAARRRFPGEWSSADVIRFVGQVRAGYDDEDDSVDPGAAEQLLLAALRDTPMPAGIDEETKAHAQFVLLSSMAGGEDLDGQKLDALLAEARQMADRWMTERS